MARIRRTRNRGPSPSLIASANSQVARLAAKVFTATVPVPFTAEQFIHAMWDREIIEKLSDAYQYIRDYDRSDWTELLHCSNFGIPRGYVQFDMDLGKARMLCPAPKLTAEYISLSTDMVGQQIIDVVQGAHAVMKKFGTVQTVITHLNERIEAKSMTLNELRYIAPWVVGLLPVDHPIHQETGNRCPTVAPQMVPLMRECAEIVVGASMCTVDARPNSVMGIAFDQSSDSGSICTTSLGLI
jgi:hypothetical protein